MSVLAVGPTAFNWLTFAVATAGLLLAASSLAWQVISWRRSGAWVRVEIGPMLVASEAGIEPCVNVTAVNHGRQAVTVRQVGVIQQDGTVFWPMQYVVPGQDDPFPLPMHRLDAFSSAWWHFRLKSFDHIAPKGDEGSKVRAYVWLTTKTVISQNALSIAQECVKYPQLMADEPEDVKKDPQRG